MLTQAQDERKLINQASAQLKSDNDKLKSQSISTLDQTKANYPKVFETRIVDGLRQQANDNLQTAASWAAGFVSFVNPVVGGVIYLANSAIYAARGQWANAGMDALGAIPVLGQLYKAAKGGIANVGRLASSGTVGKVLNGSLHFVETPPVGQAAKRLVCGVDYAAAGAVGEILRAPDATLVRCLRAGIDIPIERGTVGIRRLMSDITLNTGNEVALLRLKNGSRVLRMGGPGEVTLGANVARIIAHTHPSGRLAFSGFDIRALMKRRQSFSVLIDPLADMYTGPKKLDHDFRSK